MTYDELQFAQWEWAAPKFGDEKSPTAAIKPFAGVVEEFGELSNAISRGNAHDVEDSIGDAVIYLCDVCTRMEWQMPGLPCSRAITSELEELGNLAHAILKTAQGIRQDEDHATEGRNAVFQLLVLLDSMASKWHLGTALDCAEAAWDEVSKRSAGHAAVPKASV